MKTVLLALGLVGLAGLTGANLMCSVRGLPGTPLLTESASMSIRNYSATDTQARRSYRRAQSRRYYGSSSRRHYGGGYSRGK
jgi:hypothetical protein